MNKLFSFAVLLLLLFVVGCPAFAEESEQGIYYYGIMPEELEAETKGFPGIPITPEERAKIEAAVMAEAGANSYEMQVLIALCIKNQIGVHGDSIAEILDKPGNFATIEIPVNESVKKAVSDVFDRGQNPTGSAVKYFYNPALCVSKWHETRPHICTIDGIRFFE
jgi:hypothetical protein